MLNNFELFFLENVSASPEAEACLSICPQLSLLYFLQTKASLVLFYIMTDIILFGAINIEDYHAPRCMIQFFRRRGSINMYGTQWM